MANQFLSLPKEFDASLFYRGKREDAITESYTVNISNIAATFFSPGIQYDPHTTLVKADGSHIGLYHPVESDSRGTSPGAHLYHRALVKLIEKKTGQVLLETGEREMGSDKEISNLNPALSLGFLKNTRRLETYGKGLSRAHEVTNHAVADKVMATIETGLQSPLTLNFDSFGTQTKMVVDQSAIRAAWLNHNSLFLWLDGMKSAAMVHFDKHTSKTPLSLLDKVVSTSNGALCGAELGEATFGGAMAFFARPENVQTISADGYSLKVAFSESAGFTTESYTQPHFSMENRAVKQAERLMLALQ